MLLSLTSQYLILIILLQKQMFSFYTSENKGHPDDFFLIQLSILKFTVSFYKLCRPGFFLNLQVNTVGNEVLLCICTELSYHTLFLSYN